MPLNGVLSKKSDTAEQRTSDRRIGSLLVKAGKLNPEQAEIVGREHRREGLRFGEFAVKLKLVTRSDVERLLADQSAGADESGGGIIVPETAEDRLLEAESMRTDQAASPAFADIEPIGSDRFAGSSLTDTDALHADTRRRIDEIDPIEGSHATRQADMPAKLEQIDARSGPSRSASEPDGQHLHAMALQEREVLMRSHAAEIDSRSAESMQADQSTRVRWNQSPPSGAERVDAVRTAEAGSPATEGMHADERVRAQAPARESSRAGSQEEEHPSDLDSMHASNSPKAEASPTQRSIHPELVAAANPYSAHVDRLRALRAELLVRWSEHDTKQLMITGPAGGEGVSYVTANLAAVFAPIGVSTLVIDANLRRPRQHDMFRLSGEHGLADVLVGRLSVEDVIQRVPCCDGLAVIPAGISPGSAAELLSRDAYAHVLAKCMALFDVILIDSPAATAPEFQLMARRTGHILIVTRRNMTRFEEVSRLRGRAECAQARIMGAILNEY